MEGNDQKDGGRLGNPMGPFKEADIFQAVDNQQSEDRGRQEFPQIPDILRSRFFRRKQEKGQEPPALLLRISHINGATSRMILPIALSRSRSFP